MNRLVFSFYGCVVCFIFSIIFPLHSVAVETTEQILQKIYNNQVSDGFQVVVDLETTEQSNLEITVLGKINRDNTKILVFFNEPVSSRGMKLLSVNESGADPLLFVYMPQNKQYFQLNGESLNMQIGDSEATLSDLIPMVEWDGEHTLLGTETCLEESCYVMETKRDWEGGKRVARIGAQTLLSHSMEQFDENDKLVKKIETLETRKIGDKICATSLKITSYKDKGKGTSIKFLSGEMGIALPDTIFKPSMLKYSYSELMNLGEDVL